MCVFWGQYYESYLAEMNIGVACGKEWHINNTTDRISCYTYKLCVFVEGTRENRVSYLEF